MEEIKNNVEEIKTDSSAEEVEEVEKEQKDLIEDIDNPLTKENMLNIRNWIKQAAEAVQIMRNVWESDMEEYKVTVDHMNQLYQYNVQNRISKEDSVLKEGEEYDILNGLNKIPMDEIKKIFGEDHTIIGVDGSQTIDRIKTVAGDYFNWVSMMKEYTQLHNAYLTLIEFEEDKKMEEMRKLAEKEEDDEKRMKMLRSIDTYYSNKYLDFLGDELKERSFKGILSAFSDERKVDYWIKRTRDKLKQLKLSSKFILEISQFEKRYLEEKYHKASNILLLYFMNKIIYSNMYETNSIDRAQCICMVITLDNLICNRLDDERKERVLNNVKALVGKFIDKLPEAKPETEEK